MEDRRNFLGSSPASESEEVFKTPMSVATTPKKRYQTSTRPWNRSTKEPDDHFSTRPSPSKNVNKENVSPLTTRPRLGLSSTPDLRASAEKNKYMTPSASEWSLRKRDLSPSRAGRKQVPSTTVIVRKLPKTTHNDSSIQRRKTCPGRESSMIETEKFLTPQLPNKHRASVSSPAEAAAQVAANQQKQNNLSQKITVALRVRPFVSKEEPETVVAEDSSRNPTSIRLVSGERYERRQLEYKFEKVFNHSKLTSENEVMESGQEEVFEGIGRPSFNAFLEGYNCTIFAYGQTGSGKTFSMSGTEDNPGILPRFCDWIFRIKGPEIQDGSARLEISYFEIYNEHVYDLLASQTGKEKTHLKIREHIERGPYIEGIEVMGVRGMPDLQNWLEVGKERRATATTGINERSSRSHSVFQIRLTQTKRETLDGEERFFGCVSTANLVDLAGSERCTSSQERIQGEIQIKERFKETLAINTSLSVLKRVITVLSSNSHDRRRSTSSVHVPYRDSTLTWLLKDSLGGNSKTTLLATISPCLNQREETLSTLRFASEASSVVTKAHVNEDESLAIIRSKIGRAHV